MKHDNIIPFSKQNYIKIIPGCKMYSVPGLEKVILMTVMKERLAGY